MGYLSLCWLRAFVSLLGVSLNINWVIAQLLGLYIGLLCFASNWPWFARDYNFVY
jgi:hypothetical protein